MPPYLRSVSSGVSSETVSWFKEAMSCERIASSAAAATCLMESRSASIFKAEMGSVV